MLKRKMMNILLEWKNNPQKKCLLVKGARQVGKTYSIDAFAKANYEHYVYINFENTISARRIFSGDLDVDTITENMSLILSNVNLVPHKTLLFLDEIQSCPEAITALKFLTIDGRYDVIASGSLLGIAYKQVSSWPVGYIETIELNSLDFEEFLWAIGMSESSIDHLKHFYTSMKPVTEAIHTTMLERFKTFIVVGGMPEVVCEYIRSHNFIQVLKIQREIIQNYMDDIAKYALTENKIKAKDCFTSIPRQLSKDNKKFQYKVVDSSGNARKYGDSLSWLKDAGIIQYCFNLTTLEDPLVAYIRKDSFKIYLRDTGLLVAMLDDGTQGKIMSGELGIYKGAIYENIVAEILYKSGKPLYYYEKNSRLEIDFIIVQDNHITAVEVKSAENTKSKSLINVLDSFDLVKGIKLSTKNISSTNRTLSLPLYMALFL